MNRTYLITGANGFIGGKLIKYLADVSGCNIIAMASSAEKTAEMCIRENIVSSDKVTALENDRFFDDNFRLPEIHGAVHLASARRNRPAGDIAESIEFGRKVFEKLYSCGVNHVINVSSQSVYGNTDEIRTEETPVCPDTVYSLSKYSSEIVLKAVYSQGEYEWTNLRLDSVVQSQNLVRALSKNAKTDGVINLKGGSQVFSYIDVSDAVSAITTMLGYDGRWERVYNVGLCRSRITLTETAETIAGIAEKHGFGKININLEPLEIPLWAGMDSSRFMNDTGWKPEYSLYQMIEKVFIES